MKHKGLVSVIVPVYNAERTVVRCLESILSQTWRHLEVLAVDDGSTDQSLVLLQQMAQKDKRLRVFSQPNAGVSAARNLALSHAEGTYVQFVDSDDALPADATACMVQAMETARADLVIAPYTEVLEGLVHVRAYLDEPGVLNREQYLCAFARHPNSFYYSVLWNKLYRRSIIEAHGLRFVGSLHWGEDFAFNTQYVRWIAAAAVLTDPVYHYVRTPGGLTVGMLGQCVRHPGRSAGVKWTLYRMYVDLYMQLGQPLQACLRPLRYLFGVTLTDRSLHADWKQAADETAFLE